MYIKVIISCVYDIYLILFDLICIYFFVVNVPFEAFFFYSCRDVTYHGKNNHGCFYVGRFASSLSGLAFTINALGQITAPMITSLMTQEVSIRFNI